jgi:hypothetical protein
MSGPLNTDTPTAIGSASATIRSYRRPIQPSNARRSPACARTIAGNTEAAIAIGTKYQTSDRRAAAA